MPHIFERLCITCLLYKGGIIGIYSGDVKRITSDIALLKPTVFCSVPRVYSRFA